MRRARRAKVFTVVALVVGLGCSKEQPSAPAEADAAELSPIEARQDAGVRKDAHSSGRVDAHPGSAETIAVPEGKCGDLRLDVARGSYAACEGLPGRSSDGSGPEGCPPTGAEEYGERCCTRSLSCGIQTADGGCAASLHRPGQSAGSPPASEASAGQPGQLLEAASIHEVALTQGALFVRYRKSASERSQIVRIDKRTCAQELIANTVEPQRMAVTERALYFVRDEELFEMALGSTVESEIALPAPTNLESIVALGSTLYLSAFEYASEASAAGTSKIYELECCGRTPRLRLSTMTRVTTSQLVAIPGTSPASAERVAGWDVSGILDSSVTPASLTLFDLARGEVDNLLYEQDVDIRDLAARDGSLVLAMRDGILALNVADCSTEPLRVHAGAAIEAVAGHGRDLFWLETSPSVDTARLFVSRDGRAPLQLLETSSAEVSELHADDSHVYWVEQKRGLGQVALMRLALPTSESDVPDSRP